MKNITLEQNMAISALYYAVDKISEHPRVHELLDKLERLDCRLNTTVEFENKTIDYAIEIVMGIEE